MEVKMYFLYGNNTFKNHAKSKDLIDLVIYSTDKSDEELDKFYLNDSNWKLTLSNNQAWIWKTDNQELMEISIKTLTFKPKKRCIKYKSFSSIEKKYLKEPYTLDEIVECLEFENSKIKEKVKAILAMSGSTNFYIALWIQNC